MTVLSFVSGDAFIFRIYKYHASAINEVWSNAYEVVAKAGGDSGDLHDLIDVLLDFENGIHSDAVTFVRGTVSTWVEDSSPYNPENFLVQEFNAGEVGSVAITAPLPTRVCLAIKRSVTTGRSGKLYYRACLGEGDVELSGSGYALTTGAGMTSRVDASLTASTLGTYLGGGNGTLSIALVGKAKGSETVTKRDVTEFVVHGAVDVQMNHRWYNRAQPA